MCILKKALYNRLKVAICQVKSFLLSRYVILNPIFFFILTYTKCFLWKTGKLNFYRKDCQGFKHHKVCFLIFFFPSFRFIFTKLIYIIFQENILNYIFSFEKKKKTSLSSYISFFLMNKTLTNRILEYFVNIWISYYRFEDFTK